MAIHPEHELHTRRKGRNLALGLVLGGFIVLLFSVTLVKLSIPQNTDPRAPNFSPTAETSE